MVLWLVIHAAMHDQLYFRKSSLDEKADIMGTGTLSIDKVDLFLATKPGELDCARDAAHPFETQGQGREFPLQATMSFAVFLGSKKAGDATFL
jgi:hypothetical protein